MKKRKDFITDKSRQSCLNAIHANIKRGDSCFITGAYGSGKSELLKQINDPAAIRMRGVGSLYQLLGKMAGVRYASPRAKDSYLNSLCDHPRVIMIDEAQELPESIYPYLKIIMDEGNSLILAGLPELRDLLKAKYPDVLSRLIVLKLNPLDLDDIRKLLPDFSKDAVDLLHGSTNNMREMMKIVTSCRDYVSSEKLASVDVDTALQFIDEE